MGRLVKRSFRKKTYDLPSVEVDGGLTDHSDRNAPKVISCTKPVYFKCIVSTLALADAEECEQGVFTFTARLENGVVVASNESRAEGFDFTAPPTFMDELQSIVAHYDLAQFNGTSVHVSGLPDMYGAYLMVVYENGESIFANDNQDCFIPSDAIALMLTLFKGE